MATIRKDRLLKRKAQRIEQENAFYRLFFIRTNVSNLLFYLFDSVPIGRIQDSIFLLNEYGIFSP